MAPVKTRLIMVDGGGLFDNPTLPLALGILPLFLSIFIYDSAGSGGAVAVRAFLQLQRAGATL